MPLCYHTPAGSGGTLGLWRIQESLETLRSLWPKDILLDHPLPKHPKRQQEFFASRLLLLQLAKMARLSFKGIGKTTKGVPHLLGNVCGCTISHDWPYAAAFLHPIEAKVGIDIAVLDAQAFSVRGKFLSEAENSHCLSERRATLFWAAKEAAYKCTHGEVESLEKLALSVPGQLASTGELQIQVPLQPKALVIGYFFLPTHVVAYGPLGGQKIVKAPGPLAL